jgi:hypothetical protein
MKKRNPGKEGANEEGAVNRLIGWSVGLSQQTASGNCVGRVFSNTGSNSWPGRQAGTTKKYHEKKQSNKRIMN